MISLKCHPEEPHPSRAPIDLAVTPPPLPAPEPKEEASAPACVCLRSCVCRKTVERSGDTPSTGCLWRADDETEGGRRGRGRGGEETYTACCPGRSFSPTSGRALTQPSRCIMGDQREADAGHREGKQAPEGGGGAVGGGSRRSRIPQSPPPSFAVASQSFTFEPQGARGDRGGWGGDLEAEGAKRQG